MDFRQSFPWHHFNQSPDQKTSAWLHSKSRASLKLTPPRRDLSQVNPGYIPGNGSKTMPFCVSKLSTCGVKRKDFIKAIDPITIQIQEWWRTGVSAFHDRSKAVIRWPKAPHIRAACHLCFLVSFQGSAAGALIRLRRLHKSTLTNASRASQSD